MYKIREILEKSPSYNVLFKGTVFENLNIKLAVDKNVYHNGIYFPINGKYYINSPYDINSREYMMRFYLHEISHAIEAYERNYKNLEILDFGLPTRTDRITFSIWHTEIKVMCIHRKLANQMKIPVYKYFKKISKGWNNIFLKYDSKYSETDIKNIVGYNLKNYNINNLLDIYEKINRYWKEPVTILEMV